jgi:hypothetical protein
MTILKVSLLSILFVFQSGFAMSYYGEEGEPVCGSLSIKYVDWDDSVRDTASACFANICPAKNGKHELDQAQSVCKCYDSENKEWVNDIEPANGLSCEEFDKKSKNFKYCKKQCQCVYGLNPSCE